MKEYIYINETSLSKEFCDEIVELYENEGSGDSIDNRYNGVTAGGFNRRVKNTLDLSLKISEYDSGSKWYPYITHLTEELKRNLFLFQKRIDPKNELYDFDNVFTEIYYTCFLIQRYRKNEGKYVYHVDNRTDDDEKKFRKFTYLWYLNDVEEGGETEFFGNYRVKPQKGKMIIFPAEYFFPHTGMIPRSNDKYIVTGWIYHRV